MSSRCRGNLKTFAQCRGIVTVSGKSVLELIAKRIQARTSTQALFRTSFQSESHPVPLGPLDPLGQLLNDTEGKKKNIIRQGNRLTTQPSSDRGRAAQSHVPPSPLCPTGGARGL